MPRAIAPRMTRAHFTLIADALRESEASPAVVQRMLEKLSLTNPAFCRAKFRLAATAEPACPVVRYDEDVPPYTHTAGGR